MNTNITMVTALTKYADFSGRASRKEFWLFVLFNFLVYFAGGLLSGILHLDTETVSALLALGLLLPNLAVAVRRLHDIGKSGWWYLLYLIPAIGGIILFIFYVLDSQPGDNAYGPNPKGC